IKVKEPTVKVSNIFLDKSTLQLNVGEQDFIAATVLPSNATNPALTWTSSDETIATVDSNGVVKAINKGNATITATAQDGSDVSSEVTVMIPVTSISLNYTEKAISIGEEFTLLPTLTPSNASDQSLTWTTSDSSVASVNSQGKVKGLSQGECIITASSNSNPNIKSSCKISVVNIPISHLEITPQQIDLKKGETFLLSIKVWPENASNKNVNWISLNSDVASVNNNGLVTALEIGNTNIIAVAADGSGTSAICAVNVDFTTSANEIEDLNPMFYIDGRNLHFQNCNNCNISIYDLKGTEILKLRDLKENSYNKSLENGIYIVTINSKVYKILVQ
ncbi:MAG: Ig-like domain-containing protein, partial [Duncaniella sp.]|nr:Ig-like domain-containing protein [Duncaniella sp.]